jgi:hypothetical protein
MANKPTHGTFCWNELMTRDKSGAGKFYSELLGWKAAESGMPGMDYTLFKTGTEDAGGMMDMPTEVPKEVPSNWMSYIAVDNVDETVSKVTNLGGVILHGPQDIPEVGRFCTIQDPTGATVSLITLTPKK